MSSFLHLSRPACIGLAAALETGRLTAPFYAAALTGLVPAAMRHEVVAELEMLDRMGMRVDHIAYLLRTIARERSLSQTSRDCIDLVWTGDEGLGSQSRDTRIVVRELFATAQRASSFPAMLSIRGRKPKRYFKCWPRGWMPTPIFRSECFLTCSDPTEVRHPSRYSCASLPTPFAKRFGLERGCQRCFTIRDRFLPMRGRERVSMQSALS
jgi:hypothetical protein